MNFHSEILCFGPKKKATETWTTTTRMGEGERFLKQAGGGGERERSEKKFV